MILLVALLALVPLYGILFPPLVDLPEHILISKLLWEKLTGISHLDLEVSTFLGYRLFPALMMIVIPFCKLWGISFVYLPKVVAMTLISLHAVVIVTIFCWGLKNNSWKSCALAACFSVPAVVCMYSACWFIGFVNYTLAVTLLILAIFLTERFLRSGRLTDALWLFLTLLMVYTAHPFAPTFWVGWCFSRTLVAMATRTSFREWSRIVVLPVLCSPIFIYHFLATRATTLAPSSRSLLTQPPLISVNDWYLGRFRVLLDGVFLNADDAADSRLFARVAIGLIVLAAILVFTSAAARPLRNVMLSSLLLLFLASWVNEKLIPVPAIAWLAYDHRFPSTTFLICLAGAGMVFVRLLPASTDKLWYKAVFVLVGIVSVLASGHHLREVQRAYARFDAPARKYMEKILSSAQPVGITMPHTRYSPDGTFLQHYACLTQPDCNLPGTTFYTGYVSDLYPVKLKSASKILSARELARWRKQVPTGPLVGYWKLDEPNRNDECIDSSGNGNTGVAHGTSVVDGKSNRARSFNGNADYIDLPPISVRNAITVAAWVYSDNFVQNGFVVTKNPVNTQWALFFEANGYLKWRGGGPESNVACAAPSNRAWHHIVGKQEGTAASLYVDGVLCASGPLPAFGNAPTSISIGRYDSPLCYYYFNGQIDEVRIYDRALSDAEISQLFTSIDSRPGSSPEPKAEVKL